MWNYVVRVRQDDLYREADAQRLVKFARGERRSVFSALRQRLYPAFMFWQQRRARPMAHPVGKSQEMRPCVDA